MKCSNLNRCNKPMLIFLMTYTSVKLVIQYLKKEQNILKIF